jgi:uncharacterized protein
MKGRGASIQQKDISGYLYVKACADSRTQMKRITISLSLVITFASFATGFAQSNVSALKEKAAAGDPTAEVKLGMKYALGVPRDSQEAMKWFRLAADQGFADGQYRLGGMYDVGQSPQNPVEAIKWYTLAAKQGHKDAQYRLGVMYDQGRGTSRDYAEAARWYEKAGAQGRPEAQYRLGEMYEQGSGVAQSYPDAMKWYLLAAKQGRAEAEYKVGYLYEKGLGTSQSKSEAIAWYHKSSAHGFPDATDAMKALEEQ